MTTATADQTTARVFKVSGETIPDSPATTGKSIEEVRSILAAAYPEAANATHRETDGKDGKGNQVKIVEFLPQAGKKS